MLSNDDLHAIGAIVEEKAQANNAVFGAALGTMMEEKIDAKLEPALEAIRVGFETVDRRFGDVDRRMFEMKHELMDHADRTIRKAVGDPRAERKTADVP